MRLKGTSALVGYRAETQSKVIPHQAAPLELLCIAEAVSGKL